MSRSTRGRAPAVVHPAKRQPKAWQVCRVPGEPRRTERTMLLGFELEVEWGAALVSTTEIRRHLCRPWLHLVREHSLRDGVEIVGHPMTLAWYRAHRDTLTELLTWLRDREVMAWATDTCGLHVHLSRGALTTAQLARLLDLVYRAGSRRLLQRLSGRPQDALARWAQLDVSPAQLARAVVAHARRRGERVRTLDARLCPPTLGLRPSLRWQIEMAAWRQGRGIPDWHEPWTDRQMALNWLPRATVEMRLSKASLSPEVFHRGLELPLALAAYALGAGELQIEAWARWVVSQAGDYPALAATLTAWGYGAPGPTRGRRGAGARGPGPVAPVGRAVGTWG